MYNPSCYKQPKIDEYVFYPLELGMRLYEVKHHVKLLESRRSHYSRIPIMSILDPGYYVTLNDSVEVLLVFDNEDLNEWTNRISSYARLKYIITYDPNFEYNGLSVGMTVGEVLHKNPDIKCLTGRRKSLIYHDVVELDIDWNDKTYYHGNNKIKSIVLGSYTFESNDLLSDHSGETLEHYLQVQGNNPYLENILGNSFTGVMGNDYKTALININYTIYDDFSVAEVRFRNSDSLEVIYGFVNKHDKHFNDDESFVPLIDEMILYYIETDDPNYVTPEGIKVGIKLKAALEMSDFKSADSNISNVLSNDLTEREKRKCYYNKDGLCIILAPEDNNKDEIIGSIRKVFRKRYKFSYEIKK